MFASQSKKPITIVGIDGEFVIAKLSWRKLEQAREMFMEKARAVSRTLGADLVKVYRETDAAAPKQEPNAEEKKAARYAGYDRSVVLQKGLVSWPAEGPISPERIEDLDASVADELYKAILDYALPPMEDAPKVA